VYSHIGHTGPAKCGDYTKNIWERGKFKMSLVAHDPAFEELPRIFEVMESHIGQIAYVPKGWVCVVTKGPGALTENQCLRVENRYIYAAQFHVEMAGAPESSRKIMANFLSLAKAWGGYNPDGKAIIKPEPTKTKPEG
jgi:GMP synthase-like glutamine amidotransferase